MSEYKVLIPLDGSRLAEHSLAFLPALSKRGDLDVSLLRAFVAVVDAGGMTAATGVLNLTQAAVSQQIKRLEETLGEEFITRDRRGKPSTCYGACDEAWPPYIVSGRLTAGAGTKRALFGTTRRRDGRRQLTYRGLPLYYYVHDPVGQVLCQNVFEFGGLWLVVRPNGNLVRLPR